VEEGNAGDRPYILYSYREPIRPPRELGALHLLRSLKEALLAATLEVTSAGVHLLKEHHGTIQTVHILYAAPWADVVSRTISLEKPEPFSATKSLVDTLVAEALASPDIKTHEDLIFERTGFEVVFQEIIGARLNGYPIADFSGQECTTIDLTHVSELVFHDVREMVHDAARHLTLHTNVIEHVFARTSINAVSRVFPHTDSYLLIEYTGAATEAILIQDGSVRESASSAVGSHSFLQELALRLNTSESEAQTYIRDYITRTTHEDVTAAIGEAREAYKTVLGKLFAELQHFAVLPRNIITLADSEYKDFFLTLVEESYATLAPEYKIHSLDTALITPFVTCEPGVTVDVHTMMIALFFHTKGKVEAPLHVK
jgi:hypothetical protein